MLPGLGWKPDPDLEQGHYNQLWLAGQMAATAEAQWANWLLLVLLGATDVA